MIDLRNLINYLPFWFKENDTYRDINQVGILERFLQIVGEYLYKDVGTNSSVIPTIDNILSIIDVATTQDIFLGYIYEFLGSPPQDYRTPTTEKSYIHRPPEYVWFLTPTVPLMDYTLLGYEEGSYSHKVFSQLDRRFIMYAISLYKIRGTRKFFETLLNAYFQLYDYKLEEENIFEESIVLTTYDDPAIFYDDNIKYDSSNVDCKSCSYFLIDLSAYSGVLLQEEQIRLRNTLSKYAPINTEVQVAFKMVVINLLLNGPALIYPDMVVPKGFGLSAVDYQKKISIYVEFPYTFDGWYDVYGNLLSKSLEYTFLVRENTTITAKYS